MFPAENSNGGKTDPSCLQLEIALHRFGGSCGMTGHFVKELDKVGKLICSLRRPGIFCKNLFFKVLELVSFGENKQFFFGLVSSVKGLKFQVKISTLAARH